MNVIENAICLGTKGKRMICDVILVRLYLVSTLRLMPPSTELLGAVIRWFKRP
jgi:hypothetical protein